MKSTLLSVLESLVEETQIELAEDADVAKLASDLEVELKANPQLDVFQWLLYREDVAEIFAESDTFRDRVGPALPSWSLEDAMRAEPEKAENYLVYADSLLERGDPRGNLILLQHAGDQAKVDAHFAAHPELAPNMPAPDATTLEWRNGFVHSATLSSTADVKLGASYEALATHPAGKLLVELRVRDADIVSPRDERVDSHDDPSTLIKAIAKNPPLALRRLHFNVDDGDLDRSGWYHLGDLSELWPALRRLEELYLRGVSWELGEMNLPNVRTMILRTPGLTQESHSEIVQAALPKLEHLEIWYGYGSMYGDGSECELEDVVDLLMRTDLPRLRTLGLHMLHEPDKVCAEIAKNPPLIRQLRRLDLSLSDMSDRGAELLKNKLNHLDELDVSSTQMYTPAILAGCAKKVIAEKLRTYPAQRYGFSLE